VPVDRSATDQVRRRRELGGVALGIEERQDALDFGHGLDADAVTGEQEQLMGRHSGSAFLVLSGLCRLRPADLPALLSRGTSARKSADGGTTALLGAPSRAGLATKSDHDTLPNAQIIM
jgi:hypothetical protein